MGNFEALDRAQADGRRFEYCAYCDFVILIGDLHPDDWAVARMNAKAEHAATDDHKAQVERTKPASCRREPQDA